MAKALPKLIPVDVAASLVLIVRQLLSQRSSGRFDGGIATAAESHVFIINRRGIS